MASACDLDEALSALSDFGKGFRYKSRRSYPALDHIRLENQHGALVDKAL